MKTRICLRFITRVMYGLLKILSSENYPEEYLYIKQIRRSLPGTRIKNCDKRMTNVHLFFHIFINFYRCADADASTSSRARAPMHTIRPRFSRRFFCHFSDVVDQTAVSLDDIEPSRLRLFASLRSTSRFFLVGSTVWLDIWLRSPWPWHGQNKLISNEVHNILTY